MGHKTYISFKTEDSAYKKYIQDHLKIDMIDKSLNEPIESDNIEYIMRVIRNEYLSDSTVTIFLIGDRSSENLGAFEQRYIKRELQASLFHGEGNTQNGILGIVLPNMYNRIYSGSVTCNNCGNTHNSITLNDSTVIKEFGYNYFIPNDKCYWSEDDRFCVMAKWDDFIVNSEKFINLSFDKRSHPISEKTKVRP